MIASSTMAPTTPTTLLPTKPKPRPFMIWPGIQWLERV